MARITEEVAKLEGWADDLRLSLERELKEFDRQIADARREARGADGYRRHALNLR